MRKRESARRAAKLGGISLAVLTTYFALSLISIDQPLGVLIGK